jgi:predicted GNAT family N-acyltransferase
MRGFVVQLFCCSPTEDDGRLMRISVSLPAQMLALHDDHGSLLRRYPVSTAKKGAGELNGSLCTPRGRHVIRAKVGAGATVNTVFSGRRPTGEIWTPELAAQFPDRDWILTRILWLSGKEPGRNRQGTVDTMRRYVYIHGSPDTVAMGIPGSIGCVRMRNADIIELFDLAPALTRVDIDDFRVVTGTWAALQEHAQPLREKVFVQEQGVPPTLEMDEYDAVCQHAIAFDANGNPVGTGRLLPDGHIGRMAVSAGWRNLGIGRALLHALIETAENAGCSTQLLNAQTHAAGFYTHFGFVTEGPEFIEAGIAHCAMRRCISNT